MPASPAPGWRSSTGQKRHATAFHFLPQVTPMNAPCRLLLPLALFSSAAVFAADDGP